MSIYATQAGNKTLDISKTYVKAAQKAMDVCGANYATIPDGVSLSGGIGLRIGHGKEMVWLSILWASLVGVLVGVGLVGM